MAARQRTVEEIRTKWYCMRILIVDDEMHVRAGLRALLGSYPGLEVVAEAASGREAIQMAESLKPDVVLLDIKMPGLDGLHVTRWIKARMPATQVVIVTIEDGYREAAAAAGADEFVNKADRALSVVEALYHVYGSSGW